MRSQILAAAFGAILGLVLFAAVHAEENPSTPPSAPSQVGDCKTIDGVKGDNPKGSVFVRLTDEQYANLDRSTHLPHEAAKVFIGHLPADFDGEAKNFAYAFVFNDRGCLIAKGVFQPDQLAKDLQPLPPT